MSRGDEINGVSPDARGRGCVQGAAERVEYVPEQASGAWPAPAQLVDVLDQEVATYEALVGVTQREHQALLAFEPLRTEAVLAEKTALLERGHELRALRERLAPGGVLATVTRGTPEAEALRERRDRLRALLAALSELNQLAMLQATRQLRWVRTRRRALTGDDSPTYGPRGVGAMRAHGLGLNGMA